MLKLSPTQKRVLQRALAGDRISYGLQGDATMNVLARHEFASWHRKSGRYGKDHWWITDAGIEWAKNNLK